MNLFHLWSSYIFMRKISLFLWCFTYYIGVKYKLLQNYKSPVCHIIKGGHWISLKQISTFPNYKEARAMAEIIVSPHTNQPDLYRSEIWKPMPMSQARCLKKKMFWKNGTTFQTILYNKGVQLSNKIELYQLLHRRKILDWLGHQSCLWSNLVPVIIIWYDHLNPLKKW